MPTSKARKRRLVNIQKRKEKIALKTKTRLGLKNYQARSLQKTNGISKAIAAITDCMKRASNFDKNEGVEEKAVWNNNESFKENIDEAHEIENNTRTSELPAPAVVDLTSPGINKQNENNHPSSSQNDASKLDLKESIVDLHVEDYAVQVDEIENEKAPYFRKILNLFDILKLTNMSLSMAKRFFQRVQTISFGVTTPAISSKEFADLKERVINAENEIQMLKDRIRNKCENCNMLTSEMTQKESNFHITPPLVPPPPPPPPPPPQYPSTMRKHVDKAKHRQHENKPKHGNNETSNNLQITTDQILKVKLKRVSFNEDEKTRGRNYPRTITLDDLRNVKLKKRPLDKENATPLRDISNGGLCGMEKRLSLSVDKRTPLSRYNLRKTLRKVNMIRSPGGTPLVKSKIESGQGLTPLLTGALRKKFQNVNPPSNENSPLNF